MSLASKSGWHLCQRIELNTSNIRSLHSERFLVAEIYETIILWLLRILLPTGNEAYNGRATDVGVSLQSSCLPSMKMIRAYAVDDNSFFSDSMRKSLPSSL